MWFWKCIRYLNKTMESEINKSKCRRIFHSTFLLQVILKHTPVIMFANQRPQSPMCHILSRTLARHDSIRIQSGNLLNPHRRTSTIIIIRLLATRCLIYTSSWQKCVCATIAPTLQQYMYVGIIYLRRVSGGPLLCAAHRRNTYTNIYGVDRSNRHTMTPHGLNIYVIYQVYSNA